MQIAGRNRKKIFIHAMVVTFLFGFGAERTSASAKIALVQHANKDGGTTNSTSLAFVNPNAAGNMIAVTIRANNSASQVFNVRDSNGNLYRRAVQVAQTTTICSLAIFYAENVKGGANTVTVSDSVYGYLRIEILEYAGVASSGSLDVTASGEGDSASANSGTAAATASGDLLLGAAMSSNATSFTPGSGFTIEESVPTEPNSKLIAEDQIQGAAGAASASASLAASGAWAAALAAFKPAAGGGGTRVPIVSGLSPALGVVGSSVMISGANFGSSWGGATVKFNGVSATPASWSPSSISTTVPSGATSGNVVVTVGGVASNGMAFTVMSSASAPTITLQPGSVSIASGQAATFNVVATGSGPMTYQWNRNGAAIGGATSSTYTTPPETTADNGAQFTVLVSNTVGRLTSNPATLTVSAASALLGASSTSLSFGSVSVGSSVSQAVTLTNTGNANITISNVSLSGAGFNASGVSSGLILAPGQGATLAVTFSPAGSGSVAGNVSVASNASNSPNSIALSGSGVAAVNHSVALSWTASTSARVAGYNTYSSTVPGGPYAKLNPSPVPAMSYTDTTVQSGQTYYYVVTAVDSNNVESVHSAQVSATVP